MVLSRRDALRFSAAVACRVAPALGVPSPADPQPSPPCSPARSPPPTSRCPSSASAPGRPSTSAPDAPALDQRKEVLRILFEAGGTVIDSSPMYGRAEAVVGTLLAEMQARAKAFLATKVWTCGRGGRHRADDRPRAAKLRRRPSTSCRSTTCVDWRTHLRTLRGWKEQRTHSATSASRTTPSRRSTSWRPSSAPSASTSCSSAIRSTSARPRARLLPLCAERGVAVIVNRPFDSGALFGQVRGKALPDVGGRDRVRQLEPVLSQVHPGPPRRDLRDPRHRQPRHVRDNVAAGIGRLPDAAQRKRMAEYWAGCDGDREW